MAIARLKYAGLTVTRVILEAESCVYVVKDAPPYSARLFL